MKEIMDLKIDNEFKDLLPSLSSEEFNLLEENIKLNGCISPIVLWNGYIIDGHNRYAICKKNNIFFLVTEMNFNSRNDVIQWIIETQLGRRNLSLLQKIIIAEKHRQIYSQKAKKNLHNSKKIPMEEKINVREILSKIAGVSHSVYSEGLHILNSNNEEIINETLKGNIKIHTAYLKLKQNVQNKNKTRKPLPQTTIKHLINKTKGCCEICNWGGLGLESILLPHHIEKYCKNQNNSIDNIIMICPNCHGIIHTLENCKDENIITIILSNINKNIKNQIIKYSNILNSLVNKQEV